MRRYSKLCTDLGEEHPEQGRASAKAQRQKCACYVQETKKRPGIQQREPGQRGLGAVFGGVSSDWPWSACCSVMQC